MIFGIGTDVLKVERVEQTWARFGEHFARRLLLDDEYRLFTASKRPVRFLAMRFAAKEAIVKALGTGFSNGIWIRDVGHAAEQARPAAGRVLRARPRAVPTSSASAKGTSRSATRPGS